MGDFLLRFLWENFVKKSVEGIAGQADSRQQKPPGKIPGKGQRKPNQEWRKNRRTYAARAGPAVMAETMQDGGDGLQDRRAEGIYRARYQAYNQSINDPPIVPQSPCKSRPPFLQKPQRTPPQQQGTPKSRQHS